MVAGGAVPVTLGHGHQGGAEAVHVELPITSVAQQDGFWAVSFPWKRRGMKIFI